MKTLVAAPGSGTMLRRFLWVCAEPVSRADRLPALARRGAITFAAQTGARCYPRLSWSVNVGQWRTNKKFVGSCEDKVAGLVMHTIDSRAVFKLVAP